MPEYMTKCEPVDKKPYIVYTDEKGILYSDDPNADIPGGGESSIGSLRGLPFFYNGTVAEGATMDSEPGPAPLVTIMLGSSPLLAPNLSEWSQSERDVQVAEGVRIVIIDNTDGTMNGIYTMSVDQDTGKMTNVREVECEEELIEYDSLNCIALNMPQISADEYLIIHYPAGE